jgi:hypothetical protein
VIATAELPLTVSIEELDPDGFTGLGEPAFRTPYPVRARLDAQRRQVQRPDGSTTLSDATATVRPRKVPAGSKVTYGTDVYEVIHSRDVLGLRRVEHTELFLVGPRPS